MHKSAHLHFSCDCRRYRQLSIGTEARAMADQVQGPQPPVLLTLLPGPDRKRVQRTYSYRLTYRNPQANAPGCRTIWEVTGGRLIYQIVLEQTAAGTLRCIAAVPTPSFARKAKAASASTSAVFSSSASPGNKRSIGFSRAAASALDRNICNYCFSTRVSRVLISCLSRVLFTLRT